MGISGNRAKIGAVMMVSFPPRTFAADGTRHRGHFFDGASNLTMRVDGRELYAWCAWDTLFLPALLGTSVEVESSCRVTGAPVRLMVTPRGVESAEPAGLSVSFLLPEAEAMNANVITSFCHHVHFFSSRKAAKPWLHEHPETFLLSLADAYEFGRRMNRARYGTALDAVRAEIRGSSRG